MGVCFDTGWKDKPYTNIDKEVISYLMNRHHLIFPENSLFILEVHFKPLKATLPILLYGDRVALLLFAG